MTVTAEHGKLVLTITNPALQLSAPDASKRTNHGRAKFLNDLNPTRITSSTIRDHFQVTPDAMKAITIALK